MKAFTFGCLLLATATGNELADFLPKDSLSRLEPNNVKEINWSRVSVGTLTRMRDDDVKLLTHCGTIDGFQLAQLPATTFTVLPGSCLMTMSENSFSQLRGDQLLFLSSQAGPFISAGQIRSLHPEVCSSLAKSDVFKHSTPAMCQGYTSECLRRLTLADLTLLNHDSCTRSLSPDALTVVKKSPPLISGLKLATAVEVTEDVLKRMTSCAQLTKEDVTQLSSSVMSHMTGRCISTMEKESFSAFSVDQLSMLPIEASAQVTAAHLSAMDPACCAMWAAGDNFELLSSKICGGLTSECRKLMRPKDVVKLQNICPGNSFQAIKLVVGECVAMINRVGLQNEHLLAVLPERCISVILPSEFALFDINQLFRLPTSSFSGISPAQLSEVHPLRCSALRTIGLSENQAAMCGTNAMAKVKLIEIVTATTEDELKTLVSCANMTVDKLKSITPVVMTHMTTICMKSLPVTVFSVMTTQQLAVLPKQVVAVISAEQFGALNSVTCSEWASEDGFDQLSVDICATVSRDCLHLMRPKDIRKLESPACMLKMQAPTTQALRLGISYNDDNIAKYPTITEVDGDTLAKITDCRAITDAQVKDLSVGAVEHISIACLGSIPGAAFSSFTADQLNHFSYVHSSAITRDQVASLTTAQCSGLRGSDLVKFFPTSPTVTSLCGAISPLCVTSISSEAFKWISLSEACIASLNPTTRHALSAEQLKRIASQKWFPRQQQQQPNQPQKQPVTLQQLQFAELQRQDGSIGVAAVCLALVAATVAFAFVGRRKPAPYMRL